jgi:hypothetical protein
MNTTRSIECEAQHYGTTVDQIQGVRPLFMHRLQNLGSLKSVMQEFDIGARNMVASAPLGKVFRYGFPECSVKSCIVIGYPLE